MRSPRSLGEPTICRSESTRLAVLDALREGRTESAAIRSEVERSFDELMDRCSGWYKRRAQKLIFAFAIIVTVSLDVDAIHVADRLVKDDALRAAVVQRASVEPRAEREPPAGAAAAGRSSEQQLAEQIDAVQQIGLLLGKFARLRATGNREGTAGDATRAPEDRDEPGSR